MTFRRTLPLVLAVFLPAALSAQSAPPTVNITAPATAPTVAVGSPVTFQGSTDRGTNPTWTFGDGTSATGLTASHGYAAPGTYTVTFTVSGTISVCTSTDTDGTCLKWGSRTVTNSTTRQVTVMAPPTIGSFSAASTYIRQGTSTLLSWTTTNATSLSLSNVGSVTGTSLSVTPSAAATTYTLTATNAVGTATASLTVNTYVVGVGISPTSASLRLGESATFTGSVTPSTQGFTWSAVGGTLNGSVFTAKTSGTGSVTVTSVEDPTKKATAAVTVATVAVATPQPAGAVLPSGTNQQFAASVTGAVDATVTWSASNGGLISASGLFTAAQAGTYTLTATSHADPTKQASTQVTVNAVLTEFVVSPSSVALLPGATQAFTATLSDLGGASHQVTWSASGGTIDASGNYTAPSTAGDYVLTATSVFDATKKVTATVHVQGWVLKWTKDIVYAGTKEIAEVGPAAKPGDPDVVSITMVDHLGSPRFQWSGGTSAVLEQKFMPYGESLTDPTTASKFGKGFTNHEQTDPSGLIYMQARFYAPWFGRFLSPDPARDQHFEDTQTWNIYSYVGNDPTMKFDPDGMAPQTPDAHDVARTVVNLTPVVGGAAMVRDAWRGTTHVGGQDVPLSTGSRWFGGIVGGVTAVADALTLGLDDEVTGPVREGVSLLTTANALNNLRLAANANLQEKKEAKPEEKKAEAKPEAKAGTAANGQATDKYGNKIGGSGKPQVHTKQHDTKKAAKDAARAEGKSAPEKHPSPANPKQGPHYHPTDASGEKLPNSTHHEYP